MSYGKTNKTKLTMFSKAFGLALLLPVGANAAIDENFPSEVDLGGNYLNHINSTTAGKNLVVNPSFDLCNTLLEAAVYVLISSELNGLKGDCTKDVTWSWKNGIKGGTGYYPELSYYNPPGYTRADDKAGTQKYVAREGKTAELRAPIAIENSSKLYLSYVYQTTSKTAVYPSDNQIKLILDSGEVIVETLPDDNSNAWVIGKYIHEFSEPYTGNVNIHIVSGGVDRLDKIAFDDIFLSTEVIINPPVTDDDLDDDGILNDEDAFENDAAFSVDTDGDTYPNAYNDPCNEFCEADKLTTTNTIDAFPDEIGAFTDLTGNDLADQCTIPLTGVAPNEMCGTIPVDYDNDEDGYSNTEEGLLGTDPNDALDFPGDVDEDGIADGDDDLPFNAAASVDSDGDEYPDYYNDPCNEFCLAALESSNPIDAFPDESIAAHDQDGDSNPTHEGYTAATADMVDRFLTADCNDAAINPDTTLLSCVDPTTGRTLNIDDDIDGDGDLNADELVAGTDPKDANSNSTDIDGDGWNNDVDEFEALPLFSQPATNVLTGIGADANDIGTLGTSAGDGTVWFTWKHKNVTSYSVTIDENEGHNAPNAFLLETSETTADPQKFALRSPTLTTVEGQQITHVRLAGWVKIEMEDNAELTLLKPSLFSKSPSGNYYNPQISLHEKYNSTIDWTYFEMDYELPAGTNSLRFDLAMNQAPGVKVWFDDLELNVINDIDSDGDGISNASDNNDDSVAELADETPTLLDGEDDTPLGDDAPNSDSDAIPDDYDDDYDNDGVANPFDSDFNLFINPDLTEITTATESTLTAVAFDLDDDITYVWTINGTVDAETGNQLVFVNTDDTSGREFVVTVQATSGDEPSAVISKTIQMLGDIKNAAPRFGHTMGTTLASDRIFDVSIIDDDGDEFTFYWTLNGEQLDSTETTMTLLYADYTEDEEVTLSITATDVHGNANTQEWVVVMDNVDIDEDGYTNEQEEDAGSSPTNPDSTPVDIDGDGYSNEEEESAGTDPLDPESNLSDLDFDGWDNVYDSYPTSPLFSQPATNVLAAIGGNANINYDIPAGKDGMKWFTWFKGNPDFTANVDETAGKNALNAFLLQPGATTPATDIFQLRSPELTAVTGEKINHVRIAGWVKIEIPESSALTRLEVQAWAKNTTIDKTKTNALKLHEMFTSTTDWTYFEFDAQIDVDGEGSPADLLRVQIVMNQDPGVKVWFDDLELNVINDIDSDGDGILNAVSNNDDGDLELDGEDLTPVGGNAVDLDGDMVIDVYDDDLDNDGVHNVFDDTFNPVIAALNVTDANDTTTLTAVGYIDNSAAIEYEWKINGVVQDATTDSISFDNLSIEYSGRTFSIEVVAVSGELASMPTNTRITIPGEKQNSAPVVIFEELTDVGNGDFVVTAAMTDYDPEDADAITFKWFVNGVEVTDYNELTFTVNFADFSAGEVVEVAVEVSDQKDTVTYTKLVQLNSAPTFSFIEGETITNDEERTTEILLEAADIDGDELEVSWMVDGYPATNSNGEHVTGLNYKLNHYDYRVGATVEIVVTITDGLSITEKTLQVTLPEAEHSADELYPEGSGGGAAYWLMMLLSFGFFARRTK
ncbi:hypothetical protein RGQ13_03575 [Thalassotalea psychrophila]|uniref:Uncharacterized protein n=1 Tax=Thalassotalea psychrophila TaxID=3065647 RepID=A0ABY9TWC9_9GAMM|nr:hypothetical protein RGQ13_03575 [Colwelliaceae bacterium SQ149]